MPRTCIVTVWLLAAGVAHAGQQAPSSGTEVPLAQIGDRTFTAREVDEKWKANAPPQHMQVQQALYDGRRAAIDALVNEFLIARAAKAKGQAPEQFELAEIERRARPVTDNEIAAFYRENRDQMEGKPLEEMAPILRASLEDDRRTAAYSELLSELKRAEPNLRITLEPPRQPLEILAADPVEGPADALVTLVEFADFQCPFCRQLHPTLRQLRQHYGNRLRIVWKDFPLTQSHPQAFQAAVAARCAHDQGKFWSYHDRLFANQRALRAPALTQHALAEGLDGDRFNACLNASSHATEVRGAIATAARLGLSSTPTSYVNGRMVVGAKPFATFVAIIDEELQRLSAPTR
jgi:protein-disulfide isomerase